MSATSTVGGGMAVPGADAAPRVPEDVCSPPVVTATEPLKAPIWLVALVPHVFVAAFRMPAFVDGHPGPRSAGPAEAGEASQGVRDAHQLSGQPDPGALRAR